VPIFRNRKNQVIFPGMPLQEELLCTGFFYYAPTGRNKVGLADFGNNM
jgi:hypothetical protein